MKTTQPRHRREPRELQRALFRGLGRGKGALEAQLAREWGRVAGVDEVGRGCLAGPVVAAAVILPPDHKLRGITDSKLLPADKREKLAEQIRSRAIAVGVGVVGPEEIDRVNILNASLQAMALAIRGLEPAPGGVLVDGSIRIPALALPQRVIVKGDLKVRCIGAASIVAKVHRDRLMKELDATYPGYGFADHKGYSCPSHRKALAELGPTPVHRRSFFGVLPAGADEDQEVLAFDAESRAHLRRGEGGEDRALAHLEAEGWRLLARNWRFKTGELDLVVARGGTLAFVEVKTRAAAEENGFGPVDALTPSKLRKLSRTARAWMQAHPRAWDGLAPRFDVVTVVGDGAGAVVEHLEDAFEAADG